MAPYYAGGDSIRDEVKINIPDITIAREPSNIKFNRKIFMFVIKKGMTVL